MNNILKCNTNSEHHLHPITIEIKTFFKFLFVGFFILDVKTIKFELQ